MAHREDKLTKLTNHIESAKQKADKILISEIPTDQWLRRYGGELQEEWYMAREEIFKNQPKGKAAGAENRILKRAWGGMRGGLDGPHSPKTKTVKEDGKRQKRMKGSCKKEYQVRKGTHESRDGRTYQRGKGRNKEKKRHTSMSIYGNNTAEDSFAKIKDLSPMTKLIYGRPNGGRAHGEYKPNGEEESLIRRLRRYKLANVSLGNRKKT